MLRPRAWLAEAWTLVGADLPLFSLAACLVIALSLFSAFILALPLSVGLCIMFLEKMHGRQPQLSHLWEGITNHFPAAIVIWIAALLAAIPFHVTDLCLYGRSAPWPTVGLAVVALGAWLISMPLYFALPLIADRNLSAREAVTLSWAQVRPRRWGIFGCVVASSLVLLLGAFACGLGLIITLPLVAGAQVLAYRDFFGNSATARTTSSDDAVNEVEEHEDNEP